MFTISFDTSLAAIAQIFAVGAVGFLLVRRKVVDEAGLRLLSFLSVNVAFPMFIFYQITHHFDPHTSLWWGYPLINVGLTLTGLALSTAIFALLRHRLPKDEFLAAASLHNAGYIPLLMAMTLPLGEAGGKVYAAVILSIIGFDTCLWSIGVWLMTRQQNGRIDLRRMVNPPLVSMFSAIVLVLLLGNSAIPEIVMKPMKIVGDSAMALAMMVIGGNLAMTRFNNALPRRVAAAVGIKLVALPLVALLVLTIVPMDPIIGLVLMVQACMPTSISLSIIGRHYGTRNQDFINQTIFSTHLVSVVTIPIFLGIYGMLRH